MSGGDANDKLIEFFIQQKPGTESQLAENRKYLWNEIVPELQSLYDVSQVELDNGINGDGVQLQIIFDPYRAAELGIDIAKVVNQVAGSADISSGFVDVGRRQFIMRFEGRYDVEQLSGMILDWRDGKPVKMGDLAENQIAPGRKDGFIYQNGNKSFLL